MNGMFDCMKGVFDCMNGMFDCESYISCCLNSLEKKEHFITVNSK